MVVVPKQRKTFCPYKTCRKHTMQKVTNYKKNKESMASQGRRRYTRKQSGYGGQTKPIFKKKAKETKKVSLRLECTVCKKRRVIMIGRCRTIVLMDKAQLAKQNLGKKDRLYA
jgi:large subunit ribosomal protein L44e